MYEIMRIILDGDLEEVYYLEGHDRQDAETAFGDDIKVQFLVASETEEK